MKEKRPYNKKNQAYWESVSGSKNGGRSSLQEMTFAPPQMFGDPLIDFEAQASTSRYNKVTKDTIQDRYALIQNGLLPYSYSQDGVDCRNAIELMQKAYHNFPVVRNTIDLMVDFADAPVYLEGGNAQSRAFVEKWMKKIGIDDIKEEGFRELFRSSNLFFYRLEGTPENAADLYNYYNADVRGKKIPLAYVGINPAEITVRGGFAFGESDYFKSFSNTEIEIMKKNNDPRFKEILKSLPKEAKRDIAQRVNGERTELRLDASKVRPVFLKKQSYDPMAMPLFYGVLADINRKEELKNVDQAINRAVENVILLVTAGAPPDKGGINKNNLTALQEIFKNKTVGRVLVSDYTTKAEWVIPDIQKILNPEKYKILNDDIEQGLSNVLLGESKYSDTQLKMKVFLERLKSVRRVFLDKFLQPEIDHLCRISGFKKAPQVKFRETDKLDNADMQRLVIRMMELGILTPQQGMEVIHTGQFPEAASLKDAQKTFLEDRQDGYFMPMVNSVQLADGDIIPANNPKETGGPVKPKGTSGGRPMGNGGTPKAKSAAYSVQAIKTTVEKINDLNSLLESSFKKEYRLKSLSAKQKDMISSVAAKIVASKEMDEWEKSALQVAADTDSLSSFSSLSGVAEFGALHGLGEDSAAILYHSTKQPV